MDESDYINDDNEEILKMMRTKKIKKPINIRRRRKKNKNTNKMKDGKKNTQVIVSTRNVREKSTTKPKCTSSQNRYFPHIL